MPELPDILLYLEALRPRVVGRRLEGLRIVSPFLLRSVDPPPEALVGRRVERIDRLGKRFVFAFEGERFAVVHLMIAGRWRWSARTGARPPGRIALATLDLADGALHLVESSPKKRASLHVVGSADALRGFDAGGLNLLEATAAQFAARASGVNHTLKRFLSDPRLIDGVGNAYGDEILHAARLSPVTLTSRLDASATGRLFEAGRDVLRRWTERLSRQFAGRFPGPGEVTAFRPEFAVHGRFGLPCPACGTAVQRVRYAENETNYCPRCQTGGRLLADRSLSRLLRGDWPRTVEEWEAGVNAPRTP